MVILLRFHSLHSRSRLLHFLSLFLLERSINLVTECIIRFEPFFLFLLFIGFLNDDIVVLGDKIGVEQTHFIEIWPHNILFIHIGPFYFRTLSFIGQRLWMLSIYFLRLLPWKLETDITLLDVFSVTVFPGSMDPSLFRSDMSFLYAISRFGGNLSSRW